MYSLTKLLNGIGSSFLNEGIYWIANTIEKVQELSDKGNDTNTTYYLENVVRKYIYTNQQKIKKTNYLRCKVLLILNFLVEKGSVVGYMLRERIL